MAGSVLDACTAHIDDLLHVCVAVAVGGSAHLWRDPIPHAADTTFDFHFRARIGALGAELRRRSGPRDRHAVQAGWHDGPREARNARVGE